MERRAQKPGDDEIVLLIARARRKLNSVIAKRRKLIANLNSDLEKHGDPEKWKRYGDLLLANLSTARRVDDTIHVLDYFEEGTPELAIAGDRNRSINEIAEEYFRAYAKARNGRKVIFGRITETERDISDAEKKLDRVVSIEARQGDDDYVIADDDLDFLRSLVDPLRQKIVSRPSKKADLAFKGARRFVSTDGLEILVGKKAADNDFLTFRVARSLDVWLHAADYPGSHVVIRRAGKTAVPDRTLLEAAQLAAFYSDAREHPKASVRYTERKFVNKVKGGAPGLVRLASFRTILVEPRVPVERSDV
jgi:predicted ribosome quality control (RQC) complex YloA/Tae2 family protein